MTLWMCMNEGRRTLINSSLLYSEDKDDDVIELVRIFVLETKDLNIVETVKILSHIFGHKHFLTNV